jgi:hypothetical protein
MIPPDVASRRVCVYDRGQPMNILRVRLAGVLTISVATALLTAAALTLKRYAEKPTERFPQ